VRDADLSSPSRSVVKRSGAIPLLPLWAVWPVQSLSTCKRVHFTFFLTFYRDSGHARDLNCDLRRTTVRVSSSVFGCPFYCISDVGIHIWFVYLTLNLGRLASEGSSVTGAACYNI